VVQWENNCDRTVFQQNKKSWVIEKDKDLQIEVATLDIKLNILHP
jgi:hypothetical protein